MAYNVVGYNIPTSIGCYLLPVLDLTHPEVSWFYSGRHLISSGNTEYLNVIFANTIYKPKVNRVEIEI